ncbi:unnamed protein product [Dovyalis caffra]|uniref:AAA-type ATPase N-terminal domain-containing protein n=1 Tax=Dovyalis caffra TaxID=77055 RepID=A0AAV1RYD7_9ROSI|nr:unnamed protein product [Dovyalis caffra]
MLIRSITNDLLPHEIRDYFFFTIQTFSRRFSSQLTILIEEFKGPSANQVFEAVNIYLATKTSPSMRRVKVGKIETENVLEITMDRNEEVTDDFDDIQLKWKLVYTQVEASVYRNLNQGDLNASLRSEIRCYELSFHENYKKQVLNSYLP